MFPNVMGIMGDRRPLLMNQSDIKRILKDDDLLEHLESKKLKYITGESVVIIDGPFKSFNGIVSEIKGEKVDVEVKIFGRSNNIELNLTQIEKI